jgi:hypothetical protein
MGANAEVPLAHRFKGCHILDVVRVQVLELQPVREQHPTDKSTGGDGEATLVEGHERHNIPRGRARHGLVGGNDLLNDIGEGRKLARLHKANELLVGNVGAHPVRHHGGEVSGGLKTQAAVVLWVRKNSELKGRARERSGWKATSRTSA